MDRSPTAVLASGGLDSAALLSHALGHHAAVTPIYIRFGLRWETAELSALKRQLRALARPALKPLVVLRAPVNDVYQNHWSLTGRRVPGYRSQDAAVYLPGRNLLLLSQAGVYCALKKIPKIYLGTLSANPFADSQPPFFRSMARAVSLALGRPFQVMTPFRKMKKADVLKRWPNAPYALAFSCLRPRGHTPCGACNKCAERDQALRRQGIQTNGKI